MWDKFKLKMALLWVQIKPELYSFIKIVVKLGIDVLLPLAIEAVTQAAGQKGLSGKDRFDYATNYVKAQVPEATVNAVLNAVRIAYSNKTGEASKY